VNDLYPDARPVRRARVPTGPHELMLEIRSSNHMLFVSCTCTSRYAIIDVGDSDEMMWQRWLDLQHDPATPAPTKRTAPTAMYRPAERKS
jgi:hypothetical protein